MFVSHEFAVASAAVLQEFVPRVEDVFLDFLVFAVGVVDILPRMNAGDSRISRFGFLFDTTKQEGRGR